MKTWKTSNDPDFEEKKNRMLELYAISDGNVAPKKGDPSVVICVDEFGPLNLQPHPGKHWATAGGGGEIRRRRRRATYKRPHGVRHLLAAYDLSTDKLYGHVKLRKGRTEFLAFCRYLRTLHPGHVRIAIVLDNWSPHRSTKKDTTVGDWAEANNVELAYTPHYASWLNRIEAQFTALRYFCLDGTDHPTHEVQARMIRRHIAWRNQHAHDQELRQVVKRANVA
ncbi:MAG: transposase [Acidobacteriota bacterium]|nr:transposase [Acidobacteriota bacterium]